MKPLKTSIVVLVYLVKDLYVSLPKNASAIILACVQNALRKERIVEKSYFSQYRCFLAITMYFITDGNKARSMYCIDGE